MSSNSHDVGGLARMIVARGLAGVIAGVLVLGIGGRLVMFVSRLLHPRARESVTEAGARIGTFTLDGTLGLVIFGGLFGGLAMGIVWNIVAPWLRGDWRVVGLASVGLGGFFFISGDNIDFLILRPSGLDIALLILLVFVAGAMISRVSPWLERKLPPTDPGPRAGLYGAMALVGLTLSLPVVRGYFVEEVCSCSRPPWYTGLFLVVAAGATATALLRSVRGPTGPAPALGVRLGVWSSALAVAGGMIHLANEVRVALT